MIAVMELQKPEEIETCEKLNISYKLWGTCSDIFSYGQMGYIAGREWIVKLTAHEAEPLATYTQDNDPVYRDSALEVFLNFNPDKDMYLNLEVNANGALLCHFGKKGERSPVTQYSRARVEVKIERKKDAWSVLLRIPLELIMDCFGNIKLESNCRMKFNLYKICELEDAWHFISFTYIPSKKPDFHLPEYFAEGIIK